MKIHTTQIVERKTQTMHRLPTIEELQKTLGIETLSSLAIEGKKNTFSVEYSQMAEDFGNEPYSIYINSDDIVYGYIEDAIEQYKKFLELETK